VKNAKLKIALKNAFEKRLLNKNKKLVKNDKITPVLYEILVSDMRFITKKKLKLSKNADSISDPRNSKLQLDILLQLLNSVP
jgi:hypothetical protein